MRLRPEHQRLIAERVGGSEKDALVACNVIETLSNRVRAHAAVADKERSQPVACDFVADADSDPDHFRMRFTEGFSIFSHRLGVAIDQASAAVVGVRLLMDERCVEVVIRRSAADSSGGKQVYTATAASGKRRRSVDIDFEASGVADAADQNNLTSIAEAVYDSCDRIPLDMVCWFEVVRGEAGARLSQARGGATLPRTEELADESVSESVAGTGDVMGYSLCFAGMPDTSYAFLHHLHTAYPSLIASSYAWMRVPNSVDARALFVVNVRRAEAPVGAAQRVVQNSQPRGILVPTVRAKRVRV